MRHGKKFNKLSRTHSHRRQMLANMASSLILHKKINTTLAKAKALRGYVEPLLTKSKEDTTHSRRTVFSYLQNKEAVNELFREVAQKIAQRPGGYTRILKSGYQRGNGLYRIGGLQHESRFDQRNEGQEHASWRQENHDCQSRSAGCRSHACGRRTQG